MEVAKENKHSDPEFPACPQVRGEGEGGGARWVHHLSLTWPPCSYKNHNN